MKHRMQRIETIAYSLVVILGLFFHWIGFEKTGMFLIIGGSIMVTINVLLMVIVEISERKNAN